MINNNYPTKLFLNGPVLSFTTHPQNAIDVIGIATFTGIATAFFPDQSPENPVINDGSITYEWYFGGKKIVDAEEDPTSNASIVSVGTATTITLYGLTVDDNEKEVYVLANYVPTAYSQPVGTAVTVGSARSTGNANNELLKSNSAILTVKPIIKINTEPKDSILGEGLEHNFSVDAEIIPGGGLIQYQWQLNEVDLVDGTVEVNVQESSTGTLDVSGDDGSSFQINFSQVSTYDGFLPGVTYTIVPDSNITAKLYANGGGGGGSGFRNVTGTRGGTSVGTFTFLQNQTYILQVGESGGDGANYGDGSLIVPGGFPGGGNAPSGGSSFNRSGGGGGYTGLFISNVSQQNAILIAAGGGGSSGDPAVGGDGGGEIGGNAGNGSRGGTGGTQIGGGSGGITGNAGSNGSALQGGSGSTASVGGAGGGGGYFGGGGGSDYGPGAGGGGSGYIHPTLISEGSTSVGLNLLPESNGSFRIELISIKKTVKTTISGSNSSKLTIIGGSKGIGVIRCKISSPNVQQSPIYSKSVSYTIIEPRNIVNLEGYDNTSSAIILQRNLSESEFSITSDILNSDDICLYSPEKDIDVELDLYGAKGSNRGNFVGGEGGYSRIQFTMKKNDEYVLRGIKSNSSLFLYRGGSLIGVVGQGGGAGNTGNGGKGGGVNLAGSEGTGTGTGPGGYRISIGGLTENGTFGSASSLSLNSIYPEDQKSTGTNGGQTIKCSKGVYWRNQGLSPCQNIGVSKFRLSDGTEVTNSASINRGFKSGYIINRTAGSADNPNAGIGGDGASGGRGGTLQSGGGGGSGYSDGSISIIKTQLGGSTGNARINVRLSSGDYYVDNLGRILILSNTDNRDPRTLTKVTGKVLLGTNTCIDDARWQRFLDLARDGSQNYRLTATLDGKTTKITNATDRNIYRMINANALTLRNSLTGWVDSNYAYTLLALAWDETSGDGMSGYGSDYSILSWSPSTAYGFGYYGHSSNSFFTPTTYNHFSANWWILPPGVPDF